MMVATKISMTVMSKVVEDDKAKEIWDLSRDVRSNKCCIVILCNWGDQDDVARGYDHDDHDGWSEEVDEGKAESEASRWAVTCLVIADQHFSSQFMMINDLYVVYEDIHEDNRT